MASGEMLFVDVNREVTYVHRFQVINGDYLGCKLLGGTYENQVMELIELMDRNLPDKIIFDKAGYGHIFYDAFMKTPKEYFGVNPFGVVYAKMGVSYENE